MAKKPQEDPYYINSTREGFDYVEMTPKVYGKGVGRFSFLFGFLGGLVIFILLIIAGSHAPFQEGTEEIPSNADWSETQVWVIYAAYTIGVTGLLSLILGLIAIIGKMGRGYGVTGIILTILSFPGAYLGYQIGLIIAQIVAARSLVG